MLACSLFFKLTKDVDTAHQSHCDSRLTNKTRLHAERNLPSVMPPLELGHFLAQIYFFTPWQGGHCFVTQTQTSS